MRSPRTCLRSSTGGPRSRRAGFSLIELTIVMVIMTVAVLMLSSTMTSSSRVGPMLREDAIANTAATFQLETLRTLPFDSIYARHNDLPGDDPDGSGTAPGRHFAVEGLTVRPDDEDGHVGRFVFPEGSVGSAGGVLLQGLREDIALSHLGLPRDLNGDGLLDSANRAGDYIYLPVELVLEWQSASGPRSMRFQTALVAP
jgi:prepilin-type N-terminal cleavage/methylation domain-containing protein